MILRIIQEEIISEITCKTYLLNLVKHFDEPGELQNFEVVKLITNYVKKFVRILWGGDSSYYLYKIILQINEIKDHLS